MGNRWCLGNGEWEDCREEGCRQGGLHCPKRDGIMTSKKGTTTSQYLVKARGSAGYGGTDLMEVIGEPEFKVILGSIVALGQLS